MKKKLVITILLTLAFTQLNAQIELNYGEGKGFLSYINQNNYPGLQEAVPYGPLSFRIADNFFWIADSVKGVILKVNNKGQITKEIPVLPPNTKKPISEFKNDPCMQILIEDFAFVTGAYGEIKSIWAVDSFESKVINLDLNGNIIKEITNPCFIQLDKIEVGSKGHIFVSDKGAQKIFVFNSSNNLVSATHWEWSGFTVSNAKEHLHRLFYTHESGKLTLVTTNVKAVVISELELDLPPHFNPELWWVDEYNENLVMSYTPASEKEGKIVVVKLGFNGQVESQKTINLPIGLNRYVQHSNFEKIWVVKANYHNAPTEKFRIVPVKLTKVSKN